MSTNVHVLVLIKLRGNGGKGVMLCPSACHHLLSWVIRGNEYDQEREPRTDSQIIYVLAPLDH